MLVQRRSSQSWLSAGLRSELAHPFFDFRLTFFFSKNSSRFVIYVVCLFVCLFICLFFLSFFVFLFLVCAFRASFFVYLCVCFFCLEQKNSS